MMVNVSIIDSTIKFGALNVGMCFVTVQEDKIFVKLSTTEFCVLNEPKTRQSFANVDMPVKALWTTVIHD